MSIQIEKRTRVDISSEWSVWAVTTDIPPYVDTDTVEYRIQDRTDIDINDFTNGSVEEVDNGGGDTYYQWKGTGVFDVIMEAVNGNIKAEYDSGRITGPNYAQVYLGAIQSSIQAAMGYLFREPQTEIQIDKNKEELQLMYDTHDAKVDLSRNQADKVLEEKLALIQSVIDNRKIKALDSLADTYGTFGAGGLTLSEDMWTVYFGIVSDLVSELNDYKGAWDASTNTPDISAVTDMAPGDFYRVSVAGTTDLDGTSDWALNDIVVYTAGVDGDSSEGYWKRSRVTLPSSTTVSKVT